jgi:hypothetical protein
MAVSSSLALELTHNILVSSAYKIGFDVLFIMQGRSLMYIKKINDPSIEP